MADPLAELVQRLLADLVRSSLTNGLATSNEVLNKRSRLPKSAPPPPGEDMDARLRSIRRYITPKELAALMHWHLETVYRKIKQGMPADRDIDELGSSRRLKIYPPSVADWRRECREAWFSGRARGHAGSRKVMEIKK